MAAYAWPMLMMAMLLMSGVTAGPDEDLDTEKAAGIKDDSVEAAATTKIPGCIKYDSAGVCVECKSPFYMATPEEGVCVCGKGAGRPKGSTKNICKDCGTIRAYATTDDDGNAICEPCPTGYTPPKTPRWQATSIDSCSECIVGYCDPDRTGECVKAPNGYYSPGGWWSVNMDGGEGIPLCSDYECPSGKTTYMEGAWIKAQCIVPVCSPNTYLVKKKSRSKLLPKTTWVCVACAAGTCSPGGTADQGQEQPASCTPC